MKYSKKGDESFAQNKEKYEYSIKRKLEFSNKAENICRQKKLRIV